MQGLQENDKIKEDGDGALNADYQEDHGEQQPTSEQVDSTN